MKRGCCSVQRAASSREDAERAGLRGGLRAHGVRVSTAPFTGSLALPESTTTARANDNGGADCPHPPPPHHTRHQATHSEAEAPLPLFRVKPSEALHKTSGNYVIGLSWKLCLYVFCLLSFTCEIISCPVIISISESNLETFYRHKQLFTTQRRTLLVEHGTDFIHLKEQTLQQEP